MNRLLVPFLLACLAVPGVASFAGPRQSATYRVAADTVAGGAVRSQSAIYTNDGSAGGALVGVSTLAAPAGAARQGFIAQLAEVTAVQVSAVPASVNETETRQLAATVVLDDLTRSIIPATEVTWSVAGGPISQITTGGLATAASVYEEETAEVQGSHAGVTGTLELTVNNSLPDNFGSYAGDGLEDGWQFLHFGADNPEAGPTRDPDGDSHTNLFEYVATVDPTDPDSFFRFRIEPVTGSPSQMRLVFSPVAAGRSYVVHATTDLTLPMAPLTGATVNDEGNTRTVTDTQAGGPAKFYRVHIELP